MRIGLATSAFPDLEVVDAVRMCLRYSDHVHISPIYPKVSKKEMLQLVELGDYFGADFSVHAPFPSKGEMADLGTKRGYKLFKDSVKFASELHSDRIVFHNSEGENRKEMISHSRKLVKICEEYDIIGCFENRPADEGQIIDKQYFLDFIEDVPNAKFCFDTSHFYMKTPDIKKLVATIESIAEHIGIIHLVDTFQGQDAHMLPGFGEISLQHLTPAFMKMPDIRNIPFILEDQEPYEYEKGILNFRHALVSRKGKIDRNVDSKV